MTEKEVAAMVLGWSDMKLQSEADQAMAVVQDKRKSVEDREDALGAALFMLNVLRERKKKL